MAHEREHSAQRLWTDVEAADYIGKPPKTLANWRHLGLGPPYVKFGNCVRYWQADIDAWIDEHRRVPA